MIVLTQLIYINEGQEAIFDQFESIAIPAIARYNGRMLLRVRPSKESFIENSIEVPYEIHLAEFNTQAEFDEFMKDEERKKFLHLKEKAIRSSVLIQGTR